MLVRFGIKFKHRRNSYEKNYHLFSIAYDNHGGGCLMALF